MAMVRPAVFQISGYQNSGKTTLVNQLIELLKGRGLVAATIKHHGHGGKPDIAEGKDSAMHILSGAAVSVVEGGGRLLLHAEKQEWTIDEKIALISSFQPDVIIIEGHKHGSFPKVVILRNEKDFKLLNELTNIKAALYWESPPIETAIPLFSIHNSGKYDQLLTLLLEDGYKGK